MLRASQLGQVKSFDSVPGRGLKCQVSGINFLLDDSSKAVDESGKLHPSSLFYRQEMGAYFHDSIGTDALSSLKLLLF